MFFEWEIRADFVPFRGQLEEMVGRFSGFMVAHLVMIPAKASVGSFVMTLLRVL